MATSMFSISMKNQAHVMSILRDHLYTDKILAVLREYSCNAWDANREVGKGDVPIKVVLPTMMEPSLIIRDFGPGMSEDDLFSVYTQYGESTKQGTNEVVGMLGIGSKSGFSYSDTFTITSWNGGTKSIYVAVLDESNVGEIKKIYEKKCGDETGIEIKIPIKVADIDKFKETAKELFRFFNPYPDINLVDLTPRDTSHDFQIEGGILTSVEEITYVGRSPSKHLAVMGCVPYRFDPANAISNMDDDVRKVLGRWNCTLFFDIGELQISASREELKYSDGTNEKISERVTKLVESFIDSHTKVLKGKQASWDKRLAARELDRLHIPLGAYSDLLECKIKFAENGFFNLKSSGAQYSSGHVLWLSFDRPPIFVIKDVKRDIRKVILRDLSLVQVLPKKGVSLKKVREELDKLLKLHLLDGLKVSLLSEMELLKNNSSIAQDPEVVKAMFEKHKTDSFKLINSNLLKKRRKSDAWEVVKRVPTKEDVYVLIERFSPDFNIHDLTYQDKAFAKLLKITLPPIYGYKKGGPTPDGIEYKEWRRQFFADAVKNVWKVSPEQAMWVNGCLGQHLLPSSTVDRREEKLVSDFYKESKKILGAKHQMTLALEFWSKSIKAWNESTKAERNLISTAMRMLKDIGIIARLDDSFIKWLESLSKQYPLLERIKSEIGHASSEKRNQWLTYIKAMDLLQKEESKCSPTTP